MIPFRDVAAIQGGKLAAKIHDLDDALREQGVSPVKRRAALGALSACCGCKSSGLGRMDTDGGGVDDAADGESLLEGEPGDGGGLGYYAGGGGGLPSSGYGDSADVRRAMRKLRASDGLGRYGAGAGGAQRGAAFADGKRPSEVSAKARASEGLGDVHRRRPGLGDLGFFDHLMWKLTGSAVVPGGMTVLTWDEISVGMLGVSFADRTGNSKRVAVLSSVAAGMPMGTVVTPEQLASSPSSSSGSRGVAMSVSAAAPAVATAAAPAAATAAEGPGIFAQILSALPGLTKAAGEAAPGIAQAFGKKAAAPAPSFQEPIPSSFGLGLGKLAAPVAVAGGVFLLWKLFGGRKGGRRRGR